MDKKLKNLHKINKVEVSPYLFTKIIHSIENREKEIISEKWVWAAALSLAFLLVLNMTVSQKEISSYEPSLAEVFLLKPDNMLYHD